ncbi:hypothetical protein KIN20_000908 [Parelaphostrongylus tenuis]|uniref:Uncharacterized protein n=1 Tax=Parelaphostrongylus tenuis TaxID=148309 RepID=A0AAD5QC69_PARTN|nr:hypothetical protein KIN20_000908 [Parelaphostrongylus tenuis]
MTASAKPMTAKFAQTAKTAIACDLFVADHKIKTNAEEIRRKNELKSQFPGVFD